MSHPGPSRRLVAWVGLVVLLLYALWIGGPYLRSILVRDAAVTSWLTVASAPIDGIVASRLRVAARVGADGRLLRITNPRADPIALARGRADLERADARVVALTALVGEMDALATTRGARAAAYDALFKHNLDVKIGGMRDYVDVTTKRVELERAEATRRARLLAEGRETQSTADAASARVVDLERERLDTQTGLERARLHRRAADAGLFFLDDGSDGGDEQRSFEDARVGLGRARTDLTAARRDAESARAVVAAAERLFDAAQAADVTAPPGAIVWTDPPAAGTAVRMGSPLAGWIDCRDLLVDAPVSDAQLSLLHVGAPASVVLEGERRARSGTVLLLRGAAATLGASDLAAVAKGRGPGVGQALVALTPIAADGDACPVGRAAFVHFPGVTVLDIARARLRW